MYENISKKNEKKASNSLDEVIHYPSPGKMILRGLCFLYLILKPNVDYIFGVDSYSSRLLKPFITHTTHTKYDDNPKKEWQYLLEQQRKKVHPSKRYIANFLEKLP